MINIPPLTPQLLAELGVETGGCDFTGANAQAFLSSAASCDVQAAPGNGKTTLLVAKLALLSRSWTSRSNGICVISHTNAARFEVEKRLAHHPQASAFLSYPHFIGTVTTFIDRFLALPYLRGLGWEVSRIDDAIFAERAYAKFLGKAALRRIAARQGQRVRYWVENLELAEDGDYQPAPIPQRLSIRHRHRQHRNTSDSGRELEEIKAEMTREGYFRYGDMTALAAHALMRCPELAELVRARFPLVILDEAQDTHGPQLALLERLFAGQANVAFQRMGDQNQTLYEDSDIGPDEYWRPAPEAIPLDDTRRFGEGIAAFSSRLTVRSAQRIVGVPDMESHRYIYLFDQGSIGSVIPSYARDIRAHWPDAILSGREVWVIASRHNLYARRPQNWRPISLVDYHPAYRSGVGKKPASLCAALRKASGLFDAGGPLKEVMQLLSEASVQLLRLVEFRAASGGLPNASNLWRQLGEDGSNRHLTLRKLLFDSILAGRGAWTDATWTAFLTELSTIFGFALPVNDNEGRLAQFLQFIALGGEAENAAQGGSRSVALVDGLSLKLGSIHSVKGKTVDAVLVVETEIHREQNQRVMDLATVLPHAFGLVQRDFAQNPVELAAATNIFVGVTRPRHLLGLALRRSECSRELEVAAQNRGWIIRDLTVQPWEHEAA